MDSIFREPTSFSQATIRGTKFVYDLWTLVKALRVALPEGQTASLVWFTQAAAGYEHENKLKVIKLSGTLWPLRGRIHGEELPELDTDEVVEYYSDEVYDMKEAG